MVKMSREESHLWLSLPLHFFKMGHQASHNISGLASLPLLHETLPRNSPLLCPLL